MEAEGTLRPSGRQLSTVAVLCSCLLCAVATLAPQQAIANVGDGKNPTYTTVDVPGAGTGANQGTRAVSINTAGVIAGTYIDASNVNHGFIRTK